MNGDDDAAMFALKLNMLNMIQGEMGQQSWHQSNTEMRTSSHRQQLVNSTISSRWPNAKDGFHHKAFSVDVEAPIEHYQTNFLDSFDNRGINPKFGIISEQRSNVVETMKKKRRLSNLGYLTASFFDDYAKATRRESMTSAASFALSNRENDSDDESVISNMSGDDVYDGLNLSFPPNEKLSISELSIKETMDSFNESMSRSQKSQQAIHDWDRKMGLKRSHSKTMRLSMRSRKKLKLMIRKDLQYMGVLR